MNAPRKWTRAQIENDVEMAKALFRRRRLDEPLALYTRFYNEFEPIFQDLIDRLPSLMGDIFDPARMPELVDEPDKQAALRYLTAPPISEDDLKTLAESTLTAAALRRDTGQARRVRDVVSHIVDPHRFPWIREGRDPTPEERAQAVMASSVLAAIRKVETRRRSNARKEQEDAVENLLVDIGFQQVPPRKIALLDSAPRPGAFCRESLLGDSRADFVVRLHDCRAMPLECKASNSSVNSFKRVNHEALGKARSWIAGFGTRQVTPAAVIAGVFAPANLETAQDGGLAIVWSHRLVDLAVFIESTGDSDTGTR